MSMNALRNYQQQSILTASGPVLLVKLFDRAIRAAKEMDAAFTDMDIELIHKNACKIQDIFTHLISTLNCDTEAAKKISDQLEPLYYYYYNLCVEINLKKDRTHLPHVLKFLEEWRDVWFKIASPNGVNL